MFTNTDLNDDTKPTSPLADVTDDSCVFQVIEIVPLTRDTDGSCTTECDGGDWLPDVKQDLDSVPVCYNSFISRRSLLVLVVMGNNNFMCF